FAMNAFGKEANVELKGSGIHVLTGCPGYVKTDFAANAIKGTEAKTVRPSSVRGISPERVARAVLRGYLKRKREVVVPWTMHPAIKVYQLFPGLVERTMTKMSRRVDYWLFQFGEHAFHFRLGMAIPGFLRGSNPLRQHL